MHRPLGIVSLVLLGCRAEPAPPESGPPKAQPGTDAPGSAPSAQASRSEPVPAASAGPSAAPPSPSAAATSPNAAPSSPGAEVAIADERAEADPPLLAPDGAPLPQTEERPSASSPRFERRMAELGRAIVTGDDTLALSSFFPLVAYAQVKDVAKPERDYQYRLIANFKRDIREYHRLVRKRLGEGAKLVAVEVPDAKVEWMKPGREGNRVGYYRVLRSSLKFQSGEGEGSDANGKPSGAARAREISLELTSLISWRGEWFVVHLHGFT